MNISSPMDPMVVVNVMCHEKPMKYTHLKFNSSPPKRKDKRLPTIICSGVFAVRLLGGIVLFRLLNVSGDRQGCTPIPTWAPYGKSLYHVGIYGL